MKRFLPVLFALPLLAQLPSIPNTDFPTFRANLNNSLALGANITSNYVNPSWITSLDWSKITNTPSLGLGTVTSVAITGTAGQITATGTCTGTVTVSCTLSIPSVFLLPGTINRITLTAPATGATITVLNNKTLTVNNTVTLTATDGSTVSFLGGGTVSYLGVNETLTGNKTFTGLVDASSSVGSSPAKVGTTPPVSCTVGQVFFSTSVLAGQNLYFCTSSNVWTQQLNSGGSGASVFTGSTATATTGITGTAAAPILSLTDQSLKSPVCFEITLTASTPVTSVTINNKTAGAAFCIAWTQPASNMTTVTYGASVSNQCDPTVDAGASITTTQYFRVKADGSTVVGTGCITNATGQESGPEVAAPGTPPASKWYRWVDSTSHAPSWKTNNSSQVFNAVINKATRTSNQFLTHITDGTQTPAAIVAADLPAALSASTSINGTTIPASVTLTQTIASGTSAMGTSAISANTCASVVTTSATGTASTDAIIFTPNADISGVTGYGFQSTDGLVIYPYPTTNNVNFHVCNTTGSSITPGAVTLNWRVTR